MVNSIFPRKLKISIHDSYIVMEISNLCLIVVTLEMRPKSQALNVDVIESITDLIDPQHIITWKAIGLNFLFRPKSVMSVSQAKSVLAKLQRVLHTSSLTKFQNLFDLLLKISFAGINSVLLSQSFKILESKVYPNFHYTFGTEEVRKRRIAKGAAQNISKKVLNLTYWRFRSTRCGFSLTESNALLNITHFPSNFNNSNLEFDFSDVNVSNLIDGIINARKTQLLTFFSQTFPTFLRLS
ncbi:hypothetical protein GEMRC1_002132 [Eukaryota sp. GEM-RC1]